MATTNVNVGFPDPFSYNYAKHDFPLQYLPDNLRPGNLTYNGIDLQAQWHQQKMRDANYMANAKVLSTQMGDARAFSSPNGYYMLPPPSLGQRKFANPSMGYLDTASNRQDQPSNHAPFSEVENPYASKFGRGHGYCPVDAKMEEYRLSGGVLRTTVGQEYGRAKLNDRIRQLDAINVAKQTFQTDEMGGLGGIPATQSAPFAGALASISDELGILPQVELAQLLRSVIDALLQPGENYSAITRFVVGDANKIFALCVRLATNNSADDIMSALEFIEGNSSEDGITQLIENLLQTMTEAGIDGEANPLTNSVYRMLTTLKNLFSRLELYLKQMLKLSDAPAKDRQSASKALVKSLGFLKLIKTDAQLFAQVGNANRDTLAIDPTINPQTGRPIQTSGAFIAPTGNEAYFPYSHKGVARTNTYQPKQGISLEQQYEDARSYGSDRASSGRGSRFVFSDSAPRREDTQHGYGGRGGATFDVDTRGEFGDQSGRYLWSPMGEQAQLNLGGREIGYVGDDGAEALAEEGGDEEGAEGSAMAQLASEEGVPGMRSVRDPTTGGWDIGLQGRPGASSSAVEEDYVDDSGVVQPGARPGQEAPAPSPARSAKPYKSADVPKTRSALIAFITQLEKKHPGYSQGVYSTSSDKSVRLNTLRKMTEAGLL